MKTSILILLSLGLAQAALGQGGDLVTGARQPIRVTVQSVYQHFEGEGVRIGEASFPVSIFVPVGRSAAVALLTTAASVQGQGLESLAGVGDAQFIGTYRFDVGPGSMIASLSLNLPSGKRSLSADEFETSRLLSQNHFSFRLPIFGQGFNAAPGLTWAVPVSESAVVGLGAAYQYRGAFEPWAFLDQAYDPGNELLVNVGVDFRISPIWSLAADASYTRYGDDRLAGIPQRNAGHKVVFAVQGLGRFGWNVARLHARYRQRSRTGEDATTQLVYDIRPVPDEWEIIASYRVRLSRDAWIAALGRGRALGTSELFARQRLFELGVAPEVRVRPEITLGARALFTLGTLRGFEIGVNSVFQF
jgi:hypothetical protein